MNYLIAFLDSLSVIGFSVSGYMLVYSLSKDRRYNTVTGECFYVYNSDRIKFVCMMAVFLSWISASFWVVP